MTDRDRLADIVNRNVTAWDVEVTGDYPEKVADAILADGWVRLGDADREAMWDTFVDSGADRYADIDNDTYEGAKEDVDQLIDRTLAAAFGRDTE